jgi:hypothetical protein
MLTRFIHYNFLSFSIYGEVGVGSLLVQSRTVSESRSMPVANNQLQDITLLHERKQRKDL